MAVVVELKHAVLRAGIAHAEPGVSCRLGTHVRYAVVISLNADRAKFAMKAKMLIHCLYCAKPLFSRAGGPADVRGRRRAINVPSCCITAG